MPRWQSWSGCCRRAPWSVTAEASVARHGERQVEQAHRVHSRLGRESTAVARAVLW